MKKSKRVSKLLFIVLMAFTVTTVSAQLVSKDSGEKGPVKPPSVTPVTYTGFNYDLNFYGFTTPLLQKIGCNCTSQELYDVFIDRYSAVLVGELSSTQNLKAGIVKQGTMAAKGHMGAFNNLPLSDWIGEEGAKTYDSPVVFIGWPEFGEGQ